MNGCNRSVADELHMQLYGACAFCGRIHCSVCICPRVTEEKLAATAIVDDPYNAATMNVGSMITDAATMYTIVDNPYNAATMNVGTTMVTDAATTIVDNHYNAAAMNVGTTMITDSATGTDDEVPDLATSSAETTDDEGSDHDNFQQEIAQLSQEKALAATSSNHWVIDSGATSHFTGKRSAIEISSR